MLRHCLINLLSNASKYSGEDQLIELSSGVGKQEFWIRVSERGIGIPETEQEHLFEPFFRARNVADIPGTGLGLCIVKKCADLLEGSVSCQSDTANGTSFTLTFPLQMQPG